MPTTLCPSCGTFLKIAATDLNRPMVCNECGHQFEPTAADVTAPKIERPEPRVVESVAIGKTIDMPTIHPLRAWAQENKSAARAVIFGGAVVAMLSCACMVALCSGIGRQGKAVVKEPDSSKPNAIKAAKMFVKDYLLAPKGAEFSEIKTEQVDEENWVVSGKVDSQNANGVFLRGTFNCAVKCLGGGDWHLKIMFINDKMVEADEEARKYFESRNNK